jgi:catechol 2,3-dioxygenase-like lactoylglutathione lyase family enzyme
MLTKVDHLVIGVRDLARATETYGALLGLAPSWQGTHPGAGTANTIFRLDHVYVELLAVAGEGPVASLLAERLARDGEGPAAIALATSDIRSCVSTLQSAGLDTSGVGEGEGSGPGDRRRRWLSAFVSPSRTRGVPLLVIEHLSGPDALPPAAPLEGRESTVFGVDHVVIMTSAPEAAIDLYHNKLGLRLALDKTFESRAMRLLFFRLGGMTIECAAPIAPADAPGGDDRFWGISYRVADVVAARERVARAGFDVSEVRDGMKPGTRVCTVRRETHGVATLFIQPR